VRDHGVMSSSLYDQFGKQASKPNIMQQVQQLKKSVGGSPEQFINQMVQNGKINSNQVNSAIQLAKQFGFIK